MTILFPVLAIIFYVVCAFFTVRLVVFDSLSYSHNNGRISAGTWSFALMFGALGPISLVIVSSMMDKKARREAFFLPPKVDKIKEERVRYPYVRKFLGRIFMIGDSNDNLSHL